MLKGKTVLLGITGCLSAYKAFDIIKKLRNLHAEVKVIAAPHAFNFITELALQSIAKCEVLCKQFAVPHFDAKHKSLADECDVFVIAPASAGAIAKTANGAADNLLTSVACAWHKPLIIAPAMNRTMWQNPAVRENIAKLRRKYCALIVGPQKGLFSDGTFGRGALAEVDDIVKAVSEVLACTGIFKGKKFIVTCGVTRERAAQGLFLSAGYDEGADYGGAAFNALDFADAAHRGGAQVLLICSGFSADFIPERPYKTVFAPAAAEVLEQIKQNAAQKDFIFLGSRVTPLISDSGDAKDVQDAQNTLRLVPNIDLVSRVKELLVSGQKLAFYDGKEIRLKRILPAGGQKPQNSSGEALADNNFSPETLFDFCQKIAAALG